MADEFGFDEDFDLDDIEGGDTKAFRNLRNAYKKQQKALAEAREAAEKATKVTRKSTLEGHLKAAKVNPKVAAFIPADVEATEDGVKAWLADYGDVFNAAPEGGDGQEQQQHQEHGDQGGADDAEREAIRRAQATQQAGQIPDSLGLDAQRRALKDNAGQPFDTLVEKLRAQGLVAD